MSNMRRMRNETKTRQVHTYCLQSLFQNRKHRHMDLSTKLIRTRRTTRVWSVENIRESRKIMLKGAERKSTSQTGSTRKPGALKISACVEESQLMEATRLSTSQPESAPASSNIVFQNLKRWHIDLTTNFSETWLNASLGDRPQLTSCVGPSLPFWQSGWLSLALAPRPLLEGALLGSALGQGSIEYSPQPD